MLTGKAIQELNLIKDSQLSSSKVGVGAIYTHGFLSFRVLYYYPRLIRRASCFAKSGAIV